MRSILNFAIRRAGLVVGAALLLTVVSTFYTIKLYKNLRPDIEELLPTSDRAVIDLKNAMSRVESIDYIAVLVFSKDPAAGRKFVDAAAAKLDTLPRDTVGAVEYRVKKELDFFKEHQGLYVDLPDLIKVKNYIRDKIKFESEMYNPLNIFPVGGKKPELDIKSLEKKYNSKATSFTRFPDGYYATPDESVHVMLVYLPGKLAGVTKGYALKHAIQGAVKELNPKSFAPDLEVKFTGSVEDLLEEFEALTEDLELSTVIVLALVTLVLMLFFRSVIGVGALLTSLLMGTLWTFGLSYFAVGYLNANSAFLGSIVIGNGINFGIIYLARYFEERRLGKNHLDAITNATSLTAKATWVAALAAGLSYGSLVITAFQGFRQFGIIGLIGMILCWISAFTVLPALLTLVDRTRFGSRLQLKPVRQPFAEAMANFVKRHPKSISMGTLLVTFVSAGAILWHRNVDVIEGDLSRLGNKRSQESGSAYLSKYLNEIFQRNLSPITILTENRDEASKIAAKLKVKKDEEGESSLISSVYSFDDFLPLQQAEKIVVLREIADLLPEKKRKYIDAEYQPWMKALTEVKKVKTFKLEDLSPMLIRKFTEKNGNIGNVVLVEPPLSHATWNADRIIHFVAEIRDLTDSVAKNLPVVGTFAITADMNEAIKRDGPRATALAFLAVVLLVIFLFRRPADVSIVLGGLLLGVGWQVGVVYALGMKINFLNFIALPITFGIGIDYGVNIYQRYCFDGRKDVLNAILHTGGAVGLASCTTIIGYGSLLIASNQAFVSFGRLAILGEITCISAAIFSLPAYLLWKSRTRVDSV